jgi:Na+/H+ antiporter NhaD/arsenite permease-like protein
MSNKVKMDFSMVICLALCLASKIITPNEALAGFSNYGLITALVLLVIPTAFVHTGALDWHMTNFLRRPASVIDAQLRICIPFTFLSAFLNGSVISKAMLPIVQQCSKDSGIPLSQLLLPMSYAFLLGGTCTLIGSTTNLVVFGILSTEPQPKTPSIFLLGAYGIPLYNTFQ